ncbi:2-C-methyl-D-erythritol 4-phosphate cytidylyltransferase [Alkalibacterium sp.]|nr:MAG: 2-C-methyl-D-erythritol 4-phosphate cytidylyltransferase [Alkalibacterium sp.]
MTEDYAVILLAAGSASRFNSDENINKVLMPLNNRPVFDYSLRLFLEDNRCKTVWLVIKDEEKQQFQTRLESLYGVTPAKVNWVTGGCERQDSVALALDKLATDESGSVLVHDAARPFLTDRLIDRLIKGLNESEAVIPVIPVTDSLKRVKENEVLNSLYRAEVRRVQTPQAFSLSVLKEAFEKAETEQFYGNEEGELVERSGHQVKTVAGEELNFKLTTQLDYHMAICLIDTGWLNKLD